MNNADSPDSETSSENELIHLTRTVVELLNARDFDNSWFSENVSEDVRIEVQGKVNFGLGNFIGNYKKHTRHAKDLQCKLGNVTAIVDEKKGSGTTITSQYLSGYQNDGGRMAGTKLMSWSWDPSRERWICQAVTMMLGTPVFLTNDVFAAA